ncbi:MAG TPA: TIGR03435 family protein [Bryobacteraceae bacterium]|nr:TIGR03435 family protein [Bryobacteraceae bacterium]
MRVRIFASAFSLFVAVAIPSPASAQGTTNERPRFDVATLKADTGPVVFGVTGVMKGGPGSSDPGRVVITGRILKQLISDAYGVGLDRIYGPAWIGDSDVRFSIDATMPPATTREAFQQMLQSLLEEHLHLAIHHEGRDFPGYDLTVSPSGLKIKEWAADPNAPPVKGFRDAQGFRTLRGPSGYAMVSPGTANELGVFRISSRLTMKDFARHLGTLINFSTALPAGVETPQVSDKTGLTGVYDFKFAFAGTAVLRGAAPSSVDSDAPIDAPNLFIALEKTAGLRLVKAKAVPVDVLVVDHADKIPSGN